jgi:hypothetical protein
MNWWNIQQTSGVLSKEPRVPLPDGEPWMINWEDAYIRRQPQKVVRRESTFIPSMVRWLARSTTMTRRSRSVKEPTAYRI